MIQNLSRYQEMTVGFLEINNRKELRRLKQERKLQEFLQEIEEQYEDQEETIIRQMTKDLPENFQQRAEKLDQAKTVAKEVTTNDLMDFLRAL